jgi:hypothetical protein
MTNIIDNFTDTEVSRTIDNSSGDILPTPTKKIDLASINDVRLEMASVYRGMKSGSIETSEGTKMAYVLSQVAKLITEKQNTQANVPTKELPSVSIDEFI